MNGELLSAHPVARTGDVADASAVLERVLPRVPVTLRMTGGGGEPTLRMNAVEVGGVTLSYMYSSVDLQVVYSKTANYHVNIPLRGSVRWRVGSSVVQAGPDLAVVYGPGVSGEVFWGAGCAQLCLLLPPVSLERELERQLGHPLDAPLSFTEEMMLTSASAQGWLEALQLVCRTAEVDNEPAIHPLMAQTMENLLVDSLLLAQPHNYSAELKAPGTAGPPKAVRQVVELLHARPRHPWTVGELAREVDLSVRALQRAFLPAMGMPPMRYLRRLRLDQVHDELAAAHPGDLTVTEVASRWGFAHPGRLAAAYRAMFGETPTQTLHTHPGAQLPPGRTDQLQARPSTGAGGAIAPA